MRSAVIEDIVVFRGECAGTFLFLYAVLSIYSLPFFYILVVYCDVVLLYITLCMYREHEREMYLLCTGCVLVVYWLCTGCVLVVYLLCTGCVLVVYWLCTCCVLLCVLSREHEREMYLLCTCCVLVYCVVLLLYITLCMYREHEREMSNFLKLIELFRENRIVLLKMKQVKKMLKNAKQNFSSILARKQTCLTTPYREHHKNQDSNDSCMR